MGHVGYVHPDLEAAPVEAPRPDRVVEVARVGGVNGEAEQAAQVEPVRVRREGALHVRPDPSRLRERGGRELGLEAEGGYDGLHPEVELLCRAQPAIDRHDPCAPPRGVLEDAGDHDVPGRDAEPIRGVVLGDHEEVALDARVEGHDGPERVEAGVGPHERGGRALEDGLHVGEPLGPSPMRCDEAHLHLVTVHPLADPGTRHDEGTLGRLDAGTPGARDAQDARQQLARLARCGMVTVAPAPVMRPLASHAPSLAEGATQQGRAAPSHYGFAPRRAYTLR